MAAERPEPIIKLEPGGSAPVLSYNVAEPTSYSGRNFIDLQLPASFFATPGQADQPATPPAPPPPVIGVDPVEEAVMTAAGKQLQVYRSMYGHLTHTWVGGATVGPMPANPMVEDDTIFAITSPSDGEELRGPAEGLAVTITGEIESLVKISAIDVKVNDEPFRAAARSRNTWQFNTTVTQAGPTRIIARARGGTIQEPVVVTDSISVNVVLGPPPDTTAPVVRITSPDNGATLTGSVPHLAVLIAGTAADAIGVRSVDVRVDGGAFVPATPRGANDWSTWTKAENLSPGTHTITARCADTAGNVSENAVTVTVSLLPTDTTPPVITITSPTNGATVDGPFSGATVHVRGSSSDPSGVRLVELKLDDSAVAVSAEPKAPGDWSEWSGSLLLTDPGLHTITARSVDNRDNASETSVAVTVTLVPEVVSNLNRLILVESYRLSSYLGNYGAGRTVKTFSLLPGQKTQISISTYTKTETDAKQASSILDSFTEESSDDFEHSMSNEQSDKAGYEESFNYKVGAEAKASWGWGSAAVNAEVSGGTNATREECAKNISSATQKHVAKASAKRDVQISTSHEVKTQTGEETSMKAEIQNINVGRTLNFVFRQMNQEFITILHLVDVRIGYFKMEAVNGVPTKSYREVALPQLDALLRDVIVPAKRTEVRNTILHQLTNVFDYKDRHHVLVEEEPFVDAAGKVVPFSSYLRMRKEYTSTYLDDATGSQVTVPGVILAADKYVLRTEGVIVDALLGQGDGLDGYSHGLQDEAVRARRIENDRAELERAKLRLALKIVESGDVEAAKIFQQLFPPEPTELMPYVLAPAPASDPSTNGRQAVPVVP